MKFVKAILLSVVFLSLSTVSFADMVMPNVSITAGWWTEEGTQIMDITNSTGTMTPTGTNTFNWMGSSSANGWDLTWNIDLDTDPSISGTMSVTNNTAMTQIFVFNVYLPVSVTMPAGSQMYGGSSLTIGDSGGDPGATMATASTPGPMSIYRALNDGVVQRTLYDPNYSLTAPTGLTNSDTQNFIGETTSNILSSVIGIEHTFTVTKGDQATVNSTYYVVPEPATICLLGLGGMFLLRRKK